MFMEISTCTQEVIQVRLRVAYRSKLIYCITLFLGQPDTSWSSEEEWMAYVVDGINRILSDLYRNESSWTVIGHGTRKVKSYGPHIWHMVTDVECRPVLPAQYPEKPKTVARTLCQTLPGSH